MPGEFTLNRNARFYVAENIDDEDIRKIIDAAKESAIKEFPEHAKFREPVAGRNYKFSTSLFTIEREVHFHSDPAFKDTLYGYIILIELDGHIVVLKKNCSDLTEVLDEKFDKIGYENLAAAVDTDSAEFKKINTRNMTVSERALRNRSYEAANLKGIMSLHAAGRSIPSYLRVQDGGNIRSVTLAAGRLVEVSDRQNLDSISDWARNALQMMSDLSYQQEGFLRNFARAVDLVELETGANSAKPRSLLIETSILIEKIASKSVRIFFETRSGPSIELKGRALFSILQSIGEVYEFDDDGHVVGHESSAWLKGSPGRKTLTFHSKLMQQLRVSVEGSDLITLLKFVHKTGAYAICFDNPKYMYFAQKCFRDVSGSSEIDSLLSLFVVVPGMSATTSEKGTFSPLQTSFDAESVFDVVEDLHMADDFIFCDDLGDEWADHISFNAAKRSVFFIHSKHGDPSASASALQVVVGQAIKNLGNMYFSAEQMTSKYERSIRGKKMKGSDIERVRRRNGQFPSFIRKLTSDYGQERVCVLACSFVSKAQMSREFKKIKADEPVTGNVTQFFWIVSSFAHACKDAGVVPRIYCRP